MKRKKWMRIAGVAAVAAAAASLSTYYTTKFLVKVAVDREAPPAVQKAGERIAGAPKDKGFLDRLEAAAERLEAKENQLVELTGEDGVTLAGHFIPAKNPKRIIIAMHGWRSSWSRDFGAISDFWERQDCSVLYAEQRGQNASGGNYMGFGLIERYDVLKWLDWVNQRCGSRLPVYLAGVSMGATTVLMAAGLNLPENVHGIAADCGFTSPQAIWKHVANKNLHLIYGLRGVLADNMFRSRLQMDPEESAGSTVEALKNCRLPVLLIHGMDDHFVPVEMTYENYAACAGPKHMFLVPGADHGMSYFIDRPGYEAAVLSFWDAFDQPGEGV